MACSTISSAPADFTASVLQLGAYFDLTEVTLDVDAQVVAGSRE
ncbi:hypothetical protein [Amycolatopsis sp. CA-128772]|nr:hypothetical protein [Amycolatopsis sp. CA-128772]